MLIKKKYLLRRWLLLLPLKVGVFGSSFNPPHLAHLNLLLQIYKAFHLDRIKIVPVCQNPFSGPILEVSPQSRLDSAREMFKKYDFIEVDDQEIKRGGISYTIETLNNLSVDFEELFLIIGIDQLMLFDKWKDYKSILQKTHLIVCQRDGFEWKKELLPKKVQKHIQAFQKHQATLNTGKKVFYQKLKKTKGISSSQIRQRVQANLSISHLVPPSVDEWIKKYKLYKSLNTDFAEKVLEFSAHTLLHKKAEKIRTFDLRQFPQFPFQFTLVASGLNTRHTKILAKELHIEIRKQFSLLAMHVEGEQNGHWVVLDYGFLIVHIFYHYMREHYLLEDLWKQASFRDFPSPVA